ncbi:hypothetical protein IWQ62_005181 [Dispira parvispora]|uniref:RGS domain-containing protein n=1 Tax=Dispira parvispora TaxID=1520584 RepID=A0A9W8E5G9_9FUNG|nr:hypothetical protein IWQ62_005181 [Dispira parvispora]
MASTPATDFEHEGLRKAVIIPLIVIMALYVLISTGLFVWRGRASKDLQKRSIILTIITGTAALLVVTLYMARNIPGVPCSVSHIGSYFGFYYVHAAITARSIRLIAMAQTASAKVKRLVYPERPLSFWEKHRKAARIMCDDNKITLYMFIISSPISFYAIIPLIVSDKYGLSQRSLTCDLSWEGWPVVALSLLFIGIILPLLAYKMKGIRDAYQMRNDLIITISANIVFDLLFLASSFVPGDFPYPMEDLVFPTISVLIIQTSSVFLPWFHAERDYRRAGQLLAHSQATFYHVMNDADLVSLFCKFCENNFCTELPFFLTDYQRLKAKSVEYMSSEKPLKQYTATHLEEDQSNADTLSPTTPQSPFGKWFVSRNTPTEKGSDAFPMDDLSHEDSQQDAQRISPLPFTIVQDLGADAEKVIPSELAVDYYCFYERYFADGSAWEVNINGRTLNQLRSLVEQEQFTWSMFDAAKDEVSQLLMEDVFGKFVKANSELIGSP